MRLAAVFCLSVWIHLGYGQQPDSAAVVLTLDPPIQAGKSKQQIIQYCIPQNFKGSIRLRACQQQTSGDSVCVYDLTFGGIALKTGVGTLALALEKCSRRTVFDKSFFEAFERLGTLPPGRYTANLTLQSNDSGVLTTQGFRWSADSLLVLQSPLRWQANNLLTGGSTAAKRKPGVVGQTTPGTLEASASRRAASRLYRGLRKKGVSVQTQAIGGKSFAALYYEDWFLGRYELAPANAIKDRIAAESRTLQSNASSLVSNNLEDFRSVSSQMRELHGASRRDRGGVDGTLDLATYSGNAPDPGSGQDVTYAELQGQLSTEVLGMPVGLEGYYTTQDGGRQAKASYIRVRYDVEKAKGELLGLIGNYKRKYSETVSKGRGLEQVYGSYMGSLTGEKDALLGSLGTDYGLDGPTLSQYGGDVERVLREAPGNIDTAALLRGVVTEAGKATGEDSTAAQGRNKYDRAKARLLENKEKIQQRYEQLQAVQQKIEKYRALLSQYSDGLYLDSAINGTKLQALAADKDASYKDMAKAAAGLLPEGRAKRLASGLTNLEAGILNKYESSYTWAGQTAKGGSIGYDVGFAQVSATLGNTEYVSRSGGVDRYSAYSGRADFEPLKDQKLSVIYYGYSPSRSMISDERFSRRGVDMALPTFTSPVHIVSLLSEGTVSKSLHYAIEGAFSHRKGESNAQPVVGAGNSAIKSGLEWAVPKSSATLKGEWEHLGRDFQNSSLPFTRAGTERYTVGGSVGLFRNFLFVGVQYHTLRQESFSSIGYSTKWGFDIRTRSKRYPNVSLSYKPFATFRTYDDTLAIEQRPLLGEVWTGRGTYQIKRPGGTIHRLSALYNSNSTSSGDTSDYRSRTAQLAYIYTAAGTTVSANGGWMVLPRVIPDGNPDAIVSSYFLGAALIKSIAKRTSANVGADGALSNLGLQRLGFTLGGAYTLDKQPLTLRLQGRWARLQSDPVLGTRTVIAGMLGAGWRFQARPLAKNNTQSN